MTFSTRVRSRSQDERLAMVSVIADAPAVVGLTFEDDGWTAVQLAIAGRSPVWCCERERTPVDRLLEQFGFPRMSDEEPLALLSGTYELTGGAGGGFHRLAIEDRPLVTILICTYSRVELLSRAVESARAQSWPVEIIVVDDGSTDGTADWLAAQEGLEVYTHPVNRGKSAALDTGIAAAQGEGLLVLDDDDYLLPGAVRALATTLFSSDGLVGVFGDTIQRSGERLMDWVPATRMPGLMAVEVSLQLIPGCTGAFLVRTAAQRCAGAFDPRLTRGEDMDMFYRLARLGSIESIPFATFVADLHQGLRGSAGERWHKQSLEFEETQCLKFIQPVFLERWREARETATRREGFSWAAGLRRRGLEEAARDELQRWSAPFTRAECWVREYCELPANPEPWPCATVVVDEGDPGALEVCLEACAQRSDLWVSLEVPRDPLYPVRLFWEGAYGAREMLHTFVRHSGPYQFRLTSSPEWRPPPIARLSWLPEIVGSEALLALAAARGWPSPSCSRRGLPYAAHPVRVSACAVRQRIDAGQYPQAHERWTELAHLAPHWPGTWMLATELFRTMNMAEEARDAIRRRTRLEFLNIRRATCERTGT